MILASIIMAEMMATGPWYRPLAAARRYEHVDEGRAEESQR